MSLRFADQPEGLSGQLPDFDLPPVAEVSLNLQVDGLTAYNTLHAASFAGAVRPQYPRIEEHAALQPAFETFGAGDGLIADLQIEMIAAPLQPRYFFISPDGNELLQLQRDRIGYNWRKFGDQATYPRYPHIKAEFARQLEHYQTWLATEKLGTPTPVQCEISYVNRIALVDSNGSPSGLSQLLPCLSGLSGQTENGALQFRRQLIDEQDELVGRMHFVLRYGTDDVGDRHAHMVYQVRGRPSRARFEDCIDFLDSGRELIVSTFADMTSPTAHQLWERRA